MSGSNDENTASQVSFNETLFKISQELDEDETHQIKYLFKDSLSKTKRTASVKLLQVFQYLEEASVISKQNTSKLQRVFIKMGRNDLAAILARYHGDDPPEDSNVNAQASVVKMSGTTDQSRLQEVNLVKDAVPDKTDDGEAEEVSRGGEGAVGAGEVGREGRGLARGIREGGAGEDGAEGKREEERFHIALLYNEECENDVDLAEQLISEMGTVTLQNNQPLKVIDYYHPKLHDSIVQGPDYVLSRCMFVFFLINENSEAVGELEYAVNELIALDKFAKSQKRLDCVRPLLLKKGGHVKMPRGMADMVKVYWLRDHRERSEANLARLIQESIGKESQVITKPCSSMSAVTYNYDTDVSTEGMMSGMTNGLLHEALKSVGRIGGGTGFRVGSKYIMTASHVIKSALAINVLTPTSLEEIQTQLDMQKLNIEFKINREVLQIPLLKIAYFVDCKDLKNLTDDDRLDVTIAELKCQEGYDLPPPLLNFFNDTGADMEKKVYFLGYDGAEEDVKIGFSSTVKQGEKLEKKKSKFPQLKTAACKSLNTYVDTFGRGPKRVQLEGPFRQGGSGSPGLVIRERRASVLTILTHGYGNAPNVPDDQQVQEGPRMWYLKELMKKDNVILSDDIFGDWNTLSSDDADMND